jgi:peptide-methionine (S)-S-oxide reductase
MILKTGILIILFGLTDNLQLLTTDTVTIQQNTEIATIGGGCFWCSEAVFEGLNGVVSVESGYSGGYVKNPSYREVCNGTTGHAEVVQIRFDPAIINYEEILEIFFHTHDPTTLNQQGADVRTQYRSVIFYHNEIQKTTAELKIQEINKKAVFNKPIVTQITTFTAFYKAEDYHQNYFANNPNASYCSFVIRPKIDKFKKKYSEKLK